GCVVPLAGYVTVAGRDSIGTSEFLELSGKSVHQDRGRGAGFRCGAIPPRDADSIQPEIRSGVSSRRLCTRKWAAASDCGECPVLTSAMLVMPPACAAAVPAEASAITAARHGAIPSRPADSR